MKKLLQDRKTLYLVLGIVIISVFTLSIAYASLSTILEIHGNSEVVASTWNIHLDNVEVKSGSVSSNAPQISGTSSLSFDVDLNLPGDYYEFTVDVVNEGSIDAMIDSVSITPELSTEQARYIKYEVSYQNGESISSKQTLKKGTTTPIKVRIEYRNDINASDLPSSETNLSLKVTLLYVQSDGTGTTIKDNGVGESNISANGSLDAIGTIVTIGDQQFYTIGTEGDNVKLLSMYNLYVGNSVDEDFNVTPLASPTGKQSELAKGYVDGAEEWYGTTAFSNTNSTYEGSIVEGYVNNYETILESDYGVDVVEARLISYDELTDSETFACVEYGYCSDKYPWIYSTSYWSGSADGTYNVWNVSSDGGFFDDSCDYDDNFGVRPVIIISRDYL